MPGACRHFPPGHVSHFTHRCYQKTFLLKFARDRRSRRCIAKCILDPLIADSIQIKNPKSVGNEEEVFGGGWDLYAMGGK
jgi:hypothetical protein